MSKGKDTRKPKNPREGDLPENPEFKEFVGNMRKLLEVPKDELDKLVKEAEAKRKAS